MSEAREKARALLANATQGPWSWCCYHDPEDGQAIGVEVGSGSGVVCDVKGRMLAIEDSRLIAAAPGLLSALCDENDALEQRAEVLRRLADAAAAEQGLAQRRMAEAQEARDAALAQNRSAADLFARVRRGDYRWPDGAAWAVGEAHRLLTDGPPDGVYVRAQGDTRASPEVEVEALRKELHGQKMLAESRWNECVDAHAEVNRRIETSHDLHIRLEQAEAQAAAMREALVEIGREWTIDEDGCAFCGDGLDGDHDGCPGMIASKALANPAGRALLDRLERAEAERDDAKLDVEQVSDLCEATTERAMAAENAQFTAEAEQDALRVIIADCAAAIGNGSGCSKDASVEFMAMVPAEIRAEVAALRERAGIAEGRESAAKAERDALRAELAMERGTQSRELLTECAHTLGAVGLVAVPGEVQRLVSERDALRAEVAQDAALRAELAAEVKRLKAGNAVLDARVAIVCECVKSRQGPMGGSIARPLPGCDECGGTGGIIVDGDA